MDRTLPPTVQGFRHHYLLIFMAVFFATKVNAEQQNIPVVTFDIDVSSDAPPYIWHKEDGAPRGVFIKLINKLLADLGYTVEFVSASNKSNVQADLAFTIGVNDVAEQWLLVDSPLVRIAPMPYVLASEREHYRRKEDFKDKRVFMISKTEEMMRLTPIYIDMVAYGAEVVLIPTMSEGLVALTERDVDVGILDANMAKGIFHVEGYEGGIVELPMVMKGVNNLHILVRKGSIIASDIEKINQLQKEYMASGYISLITYHEINVYMKTRKKM